MFQCLSFFLFTISFYFLTGLLSSKEVPQFHDPIDIVYLWVDGSDPEWQDIRVAYQVFETASRPDAVAKNRFSDNEELKYSMRSLWKFASFFHHIYIVTMGQTPSWLKPDPMITIVDHREIFDDSSLLPTFNSMAIECHLHRIPGLSECFIYFNDDMFLGRAVGPHDFFSNDGKLKVLLEPKAFMPSGHPKQDDNTFLLASRNANDLLNQFFGPNRRRLICHAPYALRKSHMLEAEMQFPDAFRITSSHRFRSPNDYTITNGLVQYCSLYNKKAIPGKLQNALVMLDDGKTVKSNRQSLEKIKKSQPHTFCIQDKILNDSSKIPDLLHQFLEHYYPTPAPWEKIE